MTRGLLEIEDLDVRFETASGTRTVVHRVSLEVRPGECLGVMGESGCGKSQTFLAALGLLPATGSASGTVKFDGTNVLNDEAALRQVRGKRIGVIFQDPMTSLTPHLTIGEQLSEVLRVHRSLPRRAAREHGLKMLERVRMTDASLRLTQFPHELSGGMQQRVMIAMALLCAPDLVIADEPTTALDVTVQAEILALFRELRRESTLSLVVISHDAGVIATLCDRVAVMYAGQVIEEGDAEGLFRDPRHPYTRGLLAAVPRLDAPVAALTAIPGQPPDASDVFAGCSFAERCPRATARCRIEAPRLTTSVPDRRHFACHHPLTAAAT